MRLSLPVAELALVTLFCLTGFELRADPSSGILVDGARLPTQGERVHSRRDLLDAPPAADESNDVLQTRPWWAIGDTPFAAVHAQATSPPSGAAGGVDESDTQPTGYPADEDLRLGLFIVLLVLAALALLLCIASMALWCRSRGSKSSGDGAGGGVEAEMKEVKLPQPTKKKNSGKTGFGRSPGRNMHDLITTTVSSKKTPGTTV
jgi:hypothetical protein